MKIKVNGEEKKLELDQDNALLSTALNLMGYKPNTIVVELNNLKLVIIDNISDLFSFEYTQSLSAEKHMKLMRLMHELALCAINYDVAIVITNNVRFDGYENKEYLGRSIATFTHVKIELEKDST